MHRKVGLPLLLTLLHLSFTSSSVRAVTSSCNVNDAPMTDAWRNLDSNVDCYDDCVKEKRENRKKKKKEKREKREERATAVKREKRKKRRAGHSGQNRKKKRTGHRGQKEIKEKNGPPRSIWQ